MFTTLAQVSADASSGQNVVLPLLLAVPVVGALVVAFLRKNDSLAKHVSLGVGVVMLGLSLVLLTNVLGTEPKGDGYADQFVASFSLGDSFTLESPVKFSPGLVADSAAAWMVFLTGLLVPVAIWASFNYIKDRHAPYHAWMLLLAAALNGAFLSRDALLFYVFFEVSLVPAFFIIGGWGGPDRRRAAVKFFVYTFLGSLFMLASILYLSSQAQSFDLVTMASTAQKLSPDVRFWILAGFLAGLCVKVPLVPLHTWLPVTYTQAPAPLTALLSGLLAKLGLFGMLRLAVPMGFAATSGTVDSGPGLLMAWVAALAAIAILYAGFVAWVQTDAKTLVAYSSISHLAFAMLALAALNTMGVQSAVLYMFNHGISTAALFLMLGMIETRFGTRRFDLLSGLGRGRPKLAFFFVLFVMSSIGLPLTNGFVSEFLSILSVLPAKHLGLAYVITAGGGILLGAIYMLHMVAKLIFGPEKTPNDNRDDLSIREIGVLAPLALLVIIMGVRPMPLLDSVRPLAEAVVEPISNSTPTRATKAAAEDDSNESGSSDPSDRLRAPRRAQTGVKPAAPAAAPAGTPAQP
jgi:NADH-quinone oxidoreductase subunit M